MKKVLSFLLALMLCVSFFAGCKKSEDEKQTTLNDEDIYTEFEGIYLTIESVDCAADVHGDEYRIYTLRWHNESKQTFEYDASHTIEYWDGDTWIDKTVARIDWVLDVWSVLPGETSDIVATTQGFDTGALGIYRIRYDFRVDGATYNSWVLFETSNTSGKRLPIELTVAKTLPSCVAFEYKDGEPYCFYAYDNDGKLYRVFWNDFTGLSEKDTIVVDHKDDIKALSYDEYPEGGWTPQYEITAIGIYINENHKDHDWKITSQTSDCWSETVYYACTKCSMEQVAHGDSILPNHSWEEAATDGKTTFSCTRCNESYTYINKIGEFSYAQALEAYKTGDPGVVHERFNNPNVESEITGAIDAIIRAEFELTIEYDTISVSYDAASSMWRVDFWKFDTVGGCQSVYLNSTGSTCYIVYGE